MAHDPRLTWLKYLASENGLTISHAVNKHNPTISTLFKELNSNSDVVITKKNNDDFFSINNDEDQRSSTNILHIFSSRKTTRNIRQKLFNNNQNIIAEYAVIPSWNNPRWFIPKERSLRYGRMSLMINPSRPLALAAIYSFRLLKIFSLEQLIFPSRLIITKNAHSMDCNLDATSISQITTHIGNSARPGIIYTGSFGPIQKFTIEYLDNNELPVSFAKIGHNRFSIDAIDREGYALALINTFDLKTLQVPESLGVIQLKKWGDKVLVQKALEGGETIKGLSEICMSGLIELYNVTTQSKPTLLKDSIDELYCRLQKLNSAHLTDEHGKIRDYCSEHLLKISKNYSHLSLPIAFSHGDFTRWNVKEDQSSLYVIDWEEAAYRPAGHDLFNLILSETLQARKQEADALKTELKKAIEKDKNQSYNSYFEVVLHNTELPPHILVIFYLAEKIAYSLWHVEQHKIGGYPEKESFNRIIYAANIALEYFINMRKTGKDN